MDSGALDLDRFLRTIADQGMHTRPAGPYICAKLTNGGLPPRILPRTVLIARITANTVRPRPPTRSGRREHPGRA
ncbi:beta-galactosidase [Streptomyces sp. NPDC004074]|uniref:beta-galactosidase n=1 Tax=unclassified Streptomyces TaxID=2593676 RepID=UPI0033B939B4